MDIAKWTMERKYERPMRALIAMSAEDREGLRNRLTFSWPAGASGNPEREAKAILNHDIRGVVGRLHRKTESFIPFRGNLTWREILCRIMDKQFNRPFPANLKEEQIEVLVIRELMQRIPKSPSNADKFQIPNVKSIGKKSNLAVIVLDAIGGVVDAALDSKDLPAVNAVFAICLALHPDLEQEYLSALGF